MTEDKVKFPSTISISGDRYIIIIPKRHEEAAKKYRDRDIMVEFGPV